MWPELEKPKTDWSKIVKRTISVLAIIVALASLAVFPFCATNPVTGERELMLITESEEIEIGREADQQIIATYGLYDDPGIQQYVETLGVTIAKKSHRPHLDWKFRVLDTPVINAFAVPGGYIYVTRGTLAHMNSEAELAMVIGHEIGHVTARHSAKAYSRQLLFMGGLLLGSLASDEFAEYASFAAVGVQLLFLKYSRDQERQADDLGVEYAFMNGYNPDSFDDFFLTLNRMTVDSGGGLGLPGFLSTHPSTPNRIEDVQKKGAQVIAAQPPTGKLITGKDDYLKKINGLVVGVNPRNGFVENGWFHHPDLAFSFRVPNSWNIENSANTVQMMPKSEKAMMQFSLSKAVSPRDAFDKMVGDLNLYVVESRGTNFNGHPAYVGVGTVTQEDQTYYIHFAGVEKNGQIFTFMGLAGANDYRSYQMAFDETITSFQTLTDRNILNRKPRRLNIRRINQKMSVAKYFGVAGISFKDQKEILIMNDLQENDFLSSGQLVKIIN